VLPTFSFQFILLFFHVGSHDRCSGVRGLPNIGHRKLPKMREVHSCTRRTAQRKDLELILTIKWKPDIPYRAILVMSFGQSVIIAELWRPEVARPGNIVSNFCFFGKTTRYGNIFCILISVPNVFTVSPIDVFVFKFREKSVKSCVIYLTKKIWLPFKLLLLRGLRPKSAKASPRQCAYCPRCSRFHPNWFTFGGVIAECVNTAKLRPKVNPMFL